jgi:hypothetical protein
VLVFLARQQQRPIYQYLAFWDETLGSLQRTRFITPHQGEELLFGYGPYAYLWCDQVLKAEIEPNLPGSFEFPEPAVNEAYVRASYEPGGLIAGMLKGSVVLHAGGRAVFVDQIKTTDVNKPAAPVEELLVADDGATATIRCIGPKSLDIGEQLIELRRPHELTFTRHTQKPVSWWCMDNPERKDNRLTWKDGVELIVDHGTIREVKADGYVESPVHFGGMKFADPAPHAYITVEVEPSGGVVVLMLRQPNH